MNLCRTSACVAYCVLPALSCRVPQSGSELTESPQFFYLSRVQGYGKAKTKKKKWRNQELVPLPPPAKGWGSRG